MGYRQRLAVRMLCFVLAAALSGCAGIEKDMGTGAGITAAVDADNVIIEDREPLPMTSLGNAVYELIDIEASADCIAGQAAVISFTDPDGNEWMLSIPKNALMSDETIHMQYITSVRQDVFDGDRSAGVVLQPDGLCFMAPVYLTVKGTGVTANSCALSATTKGDNLSFSRSVYTDGQLIATIEHFSSYITYTPATQPQINQLAQVAAADYKKTVSEVQEFLKTPISVPPVPPDIEYSCEKGMNRALSMYVARASLPESELIKRILGAGRASGVLGNEQDALEYAKQLSSRLVKKADKLIRTYKGDHKKLIPVLNLTFNVLRNADILGVDAHLSDYLDTFSDWTQSAVKALIEEIKTDHVYTNLCKVMALLQGKAILEPDFEQSDAMFDTYRQEIMDAYSFELSFDGRITDVDSEGVQSEWEVTGTAELSYDIGERSENGLFLSGEGTCRFTDYTMGGKHDITLAPSSETAKVKIYITEKKDDLYVLSVSLSTLVPDTLVYTDKDGSVISLPGIGGIYRYLFPDTYDGAYYTFSLNLQNGLADVTHNINGAAQSAQGVYDITLKHTPK